MEASAHIFVDDEQILERIPSLTGTPDKAWHVIYNTPIGNQQFGVDTMLPAAWNFVMGAEQRNLEAQA